MTTKAIEAAIDSSSIMDYPEPDMSVLRNGRRKPPTFPTNLFGDDLSNWLTTAANSAGAPVDYVAGSLLAATSALIGSSCRISPWDDWEEPSALWVGLVGDPSSNKSPAIDPIIKIISMLENDMASNFEAEYRDWETKKELATCIYEDWKKDVVKSKKDKAAIPIKPIAASIPEELTRPRILGNDASIEKLALLLSTHHNGLLFYRDELAGWFGSFDKYSGQDADRAFWIESYGGRSYIIDRVKHSKPINIPHLLVSILGGIQPDKLAKLIKGADDGFTARFLWLWADAIPPFRPETIADNAIATEALRKLSGLALETGGNGSSGGNNHHKAPKMPKILKLSEEAARLFQEWRKKHFLDTEIVHGLLKSSYGKAPGQLLRLALTLELLGWATISQSLCQTSQPIQAPSSISVRAIEAAITLIDDYFKPMAERVFGDTAASEEEQLATVLAKHIVKTKAKAINTRIISRTGGLCGLNKAESIRSAISVLIEADWLFNYDQHDAIGRPRGDYKVNPKVLDDTTM
jgi:hypothetical protein